MAPKKHQPQQKGSKKCPSKSKVHSTDSRCAPKLQISAENERRLRRLLLNTERPPVGAALETPPVVSSTSGTRAQKAKRIRGIYDKLSLEGFTSDQIEQALSALKEAATFETALDWLCLNIPGNELPLKFSSGVASSTDAEDRSVRIISTARPDWVPTQRPIEKVKDGTFEVSVRFKGQREEVSLDFGKSSQATWIRQYLEHVEEEEDENDAREKEVDPSSNIVSIAKEYREARLGALEAKQKGDRTRQKHYNEIISKLKKQLPSLGLSEEDLESELHDEIDKLKMQMACGFPQGEARVPKLPCDTKFDNKIRSIASIDGSSSVEEVTHAVSLRVHTNPEKCEEEEHEKLKIDNLFSEDSYSSGAFPEEVLKQQKKVELFDPAYLQILGNIDEIWKKGDPARIPKAILQKLCQKLGWEAPNYNRVSAGKNKFLYSVSVLRTASGRGKSRKAGGLITFHHPNQDEAFRSTEEAQNMIAAFALYQLFPNLPFSQLLIDPYASFITKRLKDNEFSSEVEDNEDIRRLEFVDSLLAGISKSRASNDTKNELVYREMLSDPLSKDGGQSILVEKARMTSLDGLNYQEQREGNILKEELQSKTKNPKYMEMLKCGAVLPISKLKDDLLQLLSRNDTIIVSGETGSGKTTQVPQYILDDMIKSGLGGSCNIICTQPRRIAAMSVAERVSDERCESSLGGVGSLIGYQVRLHSVRNERTKLLFCTTGILLRKLAGDKDLVDVTHVIVDEVHERSMLGDFLLIVLKNIIKRQSNYCGRRSKLKVILMSATVDSSLFSKYFGHCPVITAEGRTHPVSVFYIEDIYEKLEYHLPSDCIVAGATSKPYCGRVGKNYMINHNRGKRKVVMSSWGDDTLLSDDYINPYYVPERYESYSEGTQLNLKNLDEDVIDFDLLEDLIYHIDETYPQGAILVFLPGVAEIDQLVEKLTATFQFRGVSSDWVLPLHSSLSSLDQRKVFLSPPENIRKIIVSTDIAETSITIDDVVFVVDTGKHKESRFNSQKKMSCMVEEWISQANAKQRRGRAGRVRPGICFCLYTLHRFEKLMRPFQVPEMLRMPLTDLCLQIKSLSLGDIKSFLLEAIEPPGEDAILSAVDFLYKVGAFQGNEELSPLGYHLAKLPVDVLIGKMMLHGAIFGCLSPVLSIAAFLSHKSPFLNPMNEKHRAMRARSTLLTNDLDGGISFNGSKKQSDHLLFVVAYNRWARILHENGSNAANHFCHSFFLNSSVLYTIRDMRIQLGSLLADIGLITLPKGFQVDGKRKEKLESMLADIRQPFNIHAIHSAVIKLVLCAGLYPNVAAAVEGSVGFPLGSNKEPSNSFSRTDCPLWFDGRREVFIHPSSVNYNVKDFQYPFLVFLEKVETSKVFLRDTSIISPYSLLLFGGTISVQHQMGVVIIDNWLKLTAPAQIAVLFKELRLTLQAVLEDLIRRPEVMNVSHNEVVKSIVNLLLEEDASQCT